jgi:hypothetical protein
MECDDVAFPVNRCAKKSLLALTAPIHSHRGHLLTLRPSRDNNFIPCLLRTIEPSLSTSAGGMEVGGKVILKGVGDGESGWMNVILAGTQTQTAWME